MLHSRDSRDPRDADESLRCLLGARIAQRSDLQIDGNRPNLIIGTCSGSADQWDPGVQVTTNGSLCVDSVSLTNLHMPRDRRAIAVIITVACIVSIWTLERVGVNGGQGSDGTSDGQCVSDSQTASAPPEEEVGLV